MMSIPYRAQVELLLQVLPHVAKEACFALKGGTAINLFVRDMPRLSVDIDLTYLPFEERSIALAGITEALRRIKAQIETVIPTCKVTMVPQSDGQEAKIVSTRVTYLMFTTCWRTKASRKKSVKDSLPPY